MFRQYRLNNGKMLLAVNVKENAKAGFYIIDFNKQRVWEVIPYRGKVDLQPIYARVHV